jgi:hypothetical protein
MQRPAYTEVQARSVDGKPVFTEGVLRKAFRGHYFGLGTEQNRLGVSTEETHPGEENEG